MQLSGSQMMAMQLFVTDPLFAWARLEDHPQLSTLRHLLEILPDQALIEGLEAARGNGRNDFPIRVLWGVFVFTVALRHTSFASCLDELHRNPALYRLLGIASVDDIPKDYNLSRFVEVVGQEPHLSELRKVFDVLVQRLGVAVPDLGQHTAGDSTGLNGRPKKNPRGVAEEIEQGLPQPCGGRKEYKDDTGKVVKVVEWNGYKHHLLVDVRHEVPLAYRITDPTVGDNEQIKPLLEQAIANLPAGRIQTMAYDKAADDEKVHEALHEHGIKPLIHNRALWQSEHERPLPGKKGRYPLNVLHDEAGTVLCYDMVSNPPVRHPMAYVGYEKDRETLKYRCPARHEGWKCPSDARCNEGKKYGMIIRVDREVDLRRFPPIPRATKQFERRYKGRTAVERVNGRTKVFWGADDGNLRGSRRFHAYLGVIMVVCVGMATLLALTARREGSMGDTRLSPIAEALREAVLAGPVEQADNGGMPRATGTAEQEQPLADSS
jgi:Transposase DDE domain